jgi:ABC-type glycerol-3-phosphate transport system substrate-binding protein
VRTRRGRPPAQRAVLATALSTTLLLSWPGIGLAADTGAPTSGGPAPSGAQTAGASNSSAAGAEATGGPSSTQGLPQPPRALNPAYNRASFVLPVNAFGSTGQLNTAQVDTAVMPLAVEQQRTFFSALQQWQAQGAVPVPSSVQIKIDPTRYIDVKQSGSDGVKILPPGSLDGNTQPALGWPETVDYVDYAIDVPVTGLYQLSMTYYNYPSCFQPGKAQADTAITGPWCGRGSSAERGILIDPPGTVPTVQQQQQTLTPDEERILQAARAAGLSVDTLPAWLNPEKAVLHVPPAPAWTILPTPPPASNTSAPSQGASSNQPGASSGAAGATTSAGGTQQTPAQATAATGGQSAQASVPPVPPPPPCAMNLTDAAGENVGYDGYEYVEAKQVPFTNQWKEPSYPVDPKTGFVQFARDNRGDDLYPIPIEAETWQTADAHDALSTYRDPLLFCLPAGHHVLRLAMVREPMAIQSITLHGPAQLPTYDQALAAWKAAGMKEVTCGLCVKVQGENIYRMSDLSIRPSTDATPGVEPDTNGYQILNNLSGRYWNQPNEWVEWKVDVPQTGLYELSFKVLQAGLQGLPVTRELTIDGQLPFDGAQWISFPFKNSWNVVTLSRPDGQPALIGLTKGTHIIRLRITLGLVGQTLAVIQQADQLLGELYREILMITGPNPDPAVDYNLDKNVVGLIPDMQAVVNALQQQAALLTYAAGGKPPVAANSINIAAQDLARLAEHPEQIQLNLARWSQDEQSLAQWLVLLEQQPMSIDWFALTTPGYKLPSANASFWKTLRVTWQSFILSFYRDYTGVGSRYSDGITVWVGFGQLWAALMSQLAASEFTPQTGIHVNFNVVPGGAGIVLLSEVSGHGPDIATGMPATTPVDFALRGGAYDFTTFPGWSQMLARWVPDATLPYQYTDPTGHTGVYGIPETQGMTLLFYRSDIMSHLDNGLPVPIPSTWPELYQIMPILQSKGMEFYYPAGPGGLTPFLYQHHGEYYMRDPQHGNLVSAINTPADYLAVKEWTDLFAQWNVPLAANFFTRFQTGEMPLGIASYNEYVQIQAGAPQLSGLWSIAPIPGTPYQCDASGCIEAAQAPNPQPKCLYPDLPNQPDLPPGVTCKIDYTSGGDSGAIIMPKTAKHPADAWKFIQWWTSAPVQLEFANEILAVAGVQAAWNTANVTALRGLPWPEQDLRVFEKAWQAFKPVPIVPGGYISDRYINNVWTNVVINGQNVRAQVEWAKENIDDELYRQEVQFGLVKAQPGHVAVGA